MGVGPGSEGVGLHRPTAVYKIVKLDPEKGQVTLIETKPNSKDEMTLPAWPELRIIRPEDKERKDGKATDPGTLRERLEAVRKEVEGQDAAVRIERRADGKKYCTEIRLLPLKK